MRTIRIIRSWSFLVQYPSPYTYSISIKPLSPFWYLLEWLSRTLAEPVKRFFFVLFSSFLVFRFSWLRACGMVSYQFYSGIWHHGQGPSLIELGLHICKSGTACCIALTQAYVLPCYTVINGQVALWNTRVHILPMFVNVDAILFLVVILISATIRLLITINAYDMLSKFCIRNNIVWLDHLDDMVQYTFHADRMVVLVLLIKWLLLNVWYRDASR